VRRPNIHKVERATSLPTLFRGGPELPVTGCHGNLIGAEETRPLEGRETNRPQSAFAELGEEA
jgi:hypothetical protein